MAQSIRGASEWEVALYDHLTEHVTTEAAALSEYKLLAEQAQSPAIRYLARLILDDEVRHHQLFADLAESVKRMAELRGEEEPVPGIHDMGKDRDLMLRITERLLEVERNDAKELEKLAKRLKDVEDTTLWGLLVRLMHDDTEKHIRILKFVRDHVKHPLGR